MKQITAKIKPASGFSHILHIALVSLLPALLFVLVRLEFFQLAGALILLSKWRMFAVKPRHWPAILRVNSIDIIVGLAVLVFMIHSGTQLLQLLWAFAYGLWLLWLKPQSTVFGVSSQALVGQTVGIVALFLQWGDKSSWVLVIATWLICYAGARHFFANFEEPLTRFLSYVWAYFSAALVWVLSHWLLFYGPIAQPGLLITVMGFGLAGIYYLEKTDRGSLALRRQLIFVMMAVILIVVIFSDWGDKTI